MPQPDAAFCTQEQHHEPVRVHMLYDSTVADLKHRIARTNIHGQLVTSASKIRSETTRLLCSESIPSAAFRFFDLQPWTHCKPWLSAVVVLRVQSQTICTGPFRSSVVGFDHACRHKGFVLAGSIACVVQATCSSGEVLSI